MRRLQSRLRALVSLGLLATLYVLVALVLLHCNRDSASPSHMGGLDGGNDVGARTSDDGGGGTGGGGELDGGDGGITDGDASADGTLVDAEVGPTTAERLLNDEGSYPRVLRAQSGDVVVSLVEQLGGGNKEASILRSSDDGATFSVVGHIDDPSFADGLCCATLYELPSAVGEYPAGTLLWAGSLGENLDAAPMSIAVWASTNEGTSWSKLPSAFVASVPRYSGSVSTGVWEPEFSLLDDGTLICHFSDETASGHSQRLAAVSSSDLSAWSSAVATVALSDPNARPGMANVRRGPAGRYFMSYELCGTDACTVHMRTSTDGSDWGDPADAGFVPQTVDGKTLRHTPTLAWSPNPGENGRFYLLGQDVYDSAGQLAPENGSAVFVNTEGAEANWYEIAAPVPVPSANNQAFCVNYSSSLLPLDESIGLEVAAYFDGATCYSYFARGALLGAGDTTGVAFGSQYRFVSVESGLCADVGGEDGGSATHAQQWPCDGLSTQRWVVEATTGGVRLRGVGDGTCLTASSAGGNLVEGTPCDSGTGEVWMPEEVGLSYYVLAHGGGTCLADKGGSLDAGASLQQAACNQLSPQIWRLEIQDAAAD